MALAARRAPHTGDPLRVGGAPRRCSMTATMPATAASAGNMGLIGVTGGTGAAAMAGFLDAGVPFSSLTVLSRSPSSLRAQSLARHGARVVQTDLDDPVEVLKAVQLVDGVYVHALAGDSSASEERQKPRAILLARALKAASDRDGKSRHLVFNSTAGAGRSTRMPRPMQLKTAVEDFFSSTSASGGFTFTSVRPAMFMEEFWKRYTRPQILAQGRFALALPSDTPLQLTAVHDVGRLAAEALCQPRAYAGRSIDLAGDELTPAQMASAFGTAQHSPVRFKPMPAWPLWFIQRDLFSITTFLRESGYGVDMRLCKAEFPWLMSFRQFLERTRWADASLSYDGSGVNYTDADPF
jgi:uncharacterized protein YbjT (DUF2867 family)